MTPPRRLLLFLFLICCTMGEGLCAENPLPTGAPVRVVSQTVGTLSLALRSLADNQTELDRAIADGSVKVPAGATKEQEEKLLSQAMNRPMDGGTTFVTGGDVSRFQRRNAPNPEMTAKQMTAAYAPAPAQQASGPVRTVRPAPTVRVTRGKTTTEEEVGK